MIAIEPVERGGVADRARMRFCALMPSEPSDRPCPVPLMFDALSPSLQIALLSCKAKALGREAARSDLILLRLSRSCGVVGTQIGAQFSTLRRFPK